MKTWKYSQQLIDFLSGMNATTSYFTILCVLMMCGLGIPIPEDITLITAGILVALKKITFGGAIVVGLVGVLAGDTIVFYVGRRYGHRVFGWPIIRTIATTQRVERAKKHILKNARFICFIARFFPGLRSVVFLTSGTMGIRPVIFITQDGLAALISVPVWIWLGWLFGSNIDHLMAVAKKIQVSLVASLFTVIFFYILWKVRKKSSH